MATNRKTNNGPSTPPDVVEAGSDHCLWLIYDDTTDEYLAYYNEVDVSESRWMRYVPRDGRYLDVAAAENLPVGWLASPPAGWLNHEGNELFLDQIDPTAQFTSREDAQDAALLLAEEIGRRTGETVRLTIEELGTREAEVAVFFKAWPDAATWDPSKDDADAAEAADSEEVDFLGDHEDDEDEEEVWHSLNLNDPLPIETAPEPEKRPAKRSAKKPRSKKAKKARG